MLRSRFAAESETLLAKFSPDDNVLKISFGDGDTLATVTVGEEEFLSGSGWDVTFRRDGQEWVEVERLPWRS